MSTQAVTRVPPPGSSRLRPSRLTLAIGLLVALPTGHAGLAQESAPGVPGPDALQAPAGDVPALTVEQAMRIMLEKSPQRSQAEITVAISELQVLRSRLDRFSASVGLSAGDTLSIAVPDEGADETGLGRETPFGNALQYGVTARARVPLFSGGANRATVEQKEVELELSRTNRRLLERDLLAAVYRAYASIQTTELRIEAARESIRRSQEAVAIVTARLNAGLSAPIELNRFRVDLLSQEQQLAELEQAAFSSRQELIGLLGLQAGDIHLQEDLRTRPAPEWPRDSGALVERALVQRLELESVRQDQQANQLDRTIVRAQQLPQLSLDLDASLLGSASWTGDLSFEDAELGPEPGLSAGLTLSWNVFDLWQTRHRLQLTRLAGKQLDAESEAQKLAIIREVRTAHQAVLSLRRRRTGVEQQLAVARDNLQIIQDLYGQGSATLLDLFDAQTSYRSALNQEASFRIQLVSADFDLQWAVGEPLLVDR